MRKLTLYLTCHCIKDKHITEHSSAEFEVLTAVQLKIRVFWNMMQCQLVYIY